MLFLDFLELLYRKTDLIKKISPGFYKCKTCIEKETEWTIYTFIRSTGKSVEFTIIPARDLSPDILFLDGSDFNSKASMYTKMYGPLSLSMKERDKLKKAYYTEFLRTIENKILRNIEDLEKLNNLLREWFSKDEDENCESDYWEYYLSPDIQKSYLPRPVNVMIGRETKTLYKYQDMKTRKWFRAYFCRGKKYIGCTKNCYIVETWDKTIEYFSNDFERYIDRMRKIFTDRSGRLEKLKIKYKNIIEGS